MDVDAPAVEAIVSSLPLIPGVSWRAFYPSYWFKAARSAFQRQLDTAIDAFGRTNSTLSLDERLAGACNTDPALTLFLRTIVEQSGACTNASALRHLVYTDGVTDWDLYNISHHVIARDTETALKWPIDKKDLRWGVPRSACTTLTLANTTTALNLRVNGVLYREKLPEVPTAATAAAAAATTPTAPTAPFSQWETIVTKTSLLPPGQMRESKKLHFERVPNTIPNVLVLWLLCWTRPSDNVTVYGIIEQSLAVLPSYEEALLELLGITADQITDPGVCHELAEYWHGVFPPTDQAIRDGRVLTEQLKTLQHQREWLPLLQSARQSQHQVLFTGELTKTCPVQ